MGATSPMARIIKESWEMRGGGCHRQSYKITLVFTNQVFFYIITWNLLQPPRPPPLWRKIFKKRINPWTPSFLLSSSNFCSLSDAILVVCLRLLSSSSRVTSLFMHLDSTIFTYIIIGGLKSIYALIGWMSRKLTNYRCHNWLPKNVFALLNNFFLNP